MSTSTALSWFTGVGAYRIPPLLLLPEVVAWSVLYSVQHERSGIPSMSARSSLSSVRTGSLPVMVDEASRTSIEDRLSKDFGLPAVFRDTGDVLEAVRTAYNKLQEAAVLVKTLAGSLPETGPVDTMWEEVAPAELKDTEDYLRGEVTEEIPSNLDWPLRWLKDWPMSACRAMKFRQFRFACCLRTWYSRVLDEFDVPFDHAGIPQEWMTVCPEAYSLFRPDTCRLHGIFYGAEVGGIVSDAHHIPSVMYDFLQMRNFDSPSPEFKGFVSDDSRNWCVLTGKEDIRELLEEGYVPTERLVHMLLRPGVYARDRVYVLDRSKRVDIFKDKRNT